MTTTEEILQNVMQMDDRAKSYVAAIATAVLQTQKMAEPATEPATEPEPACRV